MIRTMHTEVVVPLRPAEAGAAVDEWHRGLMGGRRARRFLRAGHRLWLSGSLAREGCSDPAIRRASGLVWVGARPVLVEFEVSVWSDRQTSVSLRPRRFRSTANEPSCGPLFRGILGTLAQELVELSAAETGASVPLRQRPEGRGLVQGPRVSRRFRLAP